LFWRGGARKRKTLNSGFSKTKGVPNAEKVKRAKKTEYSGVKNAGKKKHPLYCTPV